MAIPKTIRGSDIRLYIAGQPYNYVQSITYTIEYGEQPIYGIDMVTPQEIAVTRVSVEGTINGVRVKLSGGLQGVNGRPKFQDILPAPYVSIQIRDRHTNTILLWVPQAKITAETFSVSTNNVATLSFKFRGIIPYNEVDIY